MSTKYGIALGDMHCGHLVGLTPPAWQVRFPPDSRSKRKKWYDISRLLWKHFDNILKYLPEKLDFVIINGDMIDGKGKRSGGTELLTADMKQQCEIAIDCIEHIRTYCKPDAKIVGTFGTDYHTCTDGDEWEHLIADKAEFSKIGAHEWIDINGCIIDVKHHIGNSTIPHGRATAVLKDMLWNDLWSLLKMQPRADIVLRSHDHYYIMAETSEKMGMILPSLQGMGSKYGSKICSGTVDWGLVEFRITDKNNWEYYKHIHKIKSQKVKVVKI